ncbi:hypothetical protein ACHHYP_11973 [Achlya hypogyna]|uniref:Uncharacterized protein n=1 Tax=Achlya hypogyna TaxID=1202772 RepID=A0A1V9YI02_ACHHY|nr:hypothetical protein ACHHYP_11973 [Achlya hypogyna]
MYNWADPRRSSTLSVKMMEKAEAARKERLTKVRSTVSNHLHPAVEKKLPSATEWHVNVASHMWLEKQEKLSPAELYMSTLQMASGDDTGYSGKRASNQEPPEVSPFSVHNVVATESTFHPESTIQAFQGLKKDPKSRLAKAAKTESDEDPAWDAKPPSRLHKARGHSEEKLPSLQHKPGRLSRSQLLATSRSDPDLSSERRPNQEAAMDALDLYDDSYDDNDSEAAEAPADPPVVPKLDLKPLSRERKSTKVDSSDAAGLKPRGTSLAQLKDEHRAALELLKELGGSLPAEDGSLSSRFGAKLRSTVQLGRELHDSANNASEVATAALVAATDFLEQASPVATSREEEVGA